MRSSSTSPEAIGARLRARRRELRITQADLADVVGVNRRVIGELEAGKPTVQFAIVTRVAEALGLDLVLVERGA